MYNRSTVAACCIHVHAVWSMEIGFNVVHSLRRVESKEPWWWWWWW